MYGREELKVYYADLEGQLYISNPFPGHDDTDTFIRKYEADSVMDAYEARIKELESQLENVQASTYAENVDANMALIKANERIKELEAENVRLHQANFDALAHFDTLKEDYEELKKRVPVWHKLDKPLYVDENGNDVWDLPNEDEADANGDVYTILKCGARGTEPWDEIDPETIAMWCELPTEPPTTEESSATEKENG